jgi:hypothetical protein
MARSKLDFVRQQGFAHAGADSGDALYSALMFQPRVVAAVVLTGILLQHPRHNPVDAFYNRLLARRRHLRSIDAAPPPRRFAQAVAATLAFAISAALLMESSAIAWAFQGLLGGAVVAVVFGRFCAGSYLYELSRSALAATTRRGMPIPQPGARR